MRPPLPWLLLPGEDYTPEYLQVVSDCYHDIDRATAGWHRASGVTCPSGCGRCCTMIVPDCTPIEAEYLARFLLRRRPEAASALLSRETMDPPCPFYRDDTDHHCSVYEARPVLCRTFGFAGARTKTGAVGYRLCRSMAGPAEWQGRRELTTPGETEAIGTTPPVMAELAAPVQNLAPGAAGSPLDRAVGSALGRLLLRTQLASSEMFASQGDDERPRNPTTPSRTSRFPA